MGTLLYRYFDHLSHVQRAIHGLWEAVELRQARGGLARVAQSSIDLGDIKTLVNTISSLLEVFQARFIFTCCAVVELNSRSSKVASPWRNGWVCLLRYVLLGACLSCRRMTNLAQRFEADRNERLAKEIIEKQVCFVC